MHGESAISSVPWEKRLGGSGPRGQCGTNLLVLVSTVMLAEQGQGQSTRVASPWLALRGKKNPIDQSLDRSADTHKINEQTPSPHRKTGNTHQNLKPFANLGLAKNKKPKQTAPALSRLCVQNDKRAGGCLEARPGLGSPGQTPRKMRPITPTTQTETVSRWGAGPTLGSGSGVLGALQLVLLIGDRKLVVASPHACYCKVGGGPCV